MLYQIIDGTLLAGSEVVLEHFDFEVKGRDKIAVVGPNGAGKTTFLKLLAGELSLERDDKRAAQGIRLARNITIGILHQKPFFQSEDRTVEEEMMEHCPCRDTWEKERYDYEQEYDRILTGFGFSKEDKNKKLSEFSGGQQTRLALIRLLLQQPDIMLLDEPTNHLDVETVEWLESYIKNYPKAVVMVSHDRFFLDRTADKIYELEDKKLIAYAGNYTQYRQEKQKNLEIQWKKYQHQQEEIRKLEENITRFKSKPKKAAFARSRKKILERMEKIEQPHQQASHIFTGELLPERIGNKLVLEAEELQIGYEKVLQTISLRVRRGQKIAVIGPNGIGKSTFLKTVAGILNPKKGSLKLGEQIDMGYFDQQSAALEGEETVLEHYSKSFPGKNEKEARQYLAAYLFRGEQVGRMIEYLSGGEKSRLLLAELLAEKPNFLVLDEPTNHMDIPAKETLESAFQTYKGTMLFVSHDRYFVSQIADALLIFGEEGVTYYPFGYTHYLQHLEQNKESGGEILPGALSAKDQALVDGLKSVPKGATLLGHEWSQERLYWDWKFRLAKESMEQCLEQAIETDRQYQEQQMFAWPEEVSEEWIQKKQKADQRWEKACMAWYELLEEAEGIPEQI